MAGLGNNGNGLREGKDSTTINMRDEVRWEMIKNALIAGATLKEAAVAAGISKVTACRIVYQPDRKSVV